MIGASLEALSFGAITHVEIGGVAIELFKGGDGPHLLFLHGLDGIEGAADLLRRLTATFTVFAPSHPGFGASELPASITSVDDLAYFYLDLIDVLTIEKPLIVGVSLGAWLATEMLTKNPGAGRRAILGSPLGLRTAHRRDRDVVDIFMLPRAEVDARMQNGTPALPADLGMLSDDQLQRYARANEAISVYGWSPYLNNPKLAQRLHRVSLPTLVLWGADDAIVGDGYRERYAAALPTAQTETVGAAGHRVHADQPDSVAALITDFANN